eukprot:15365410-Ditylum_brightwellii.AAC.1
MLKAWVQVHHLYSLHDREDIESVLLDKGHRGANHDPCTIAARNNATEVILHPHEVGHDTSICP